MRAFTHPSRVVALLFLCVIAVGTLLLMQPAAQAQGRATDVVTALFTSVSAVCVTGLVVVDTGTHWSTFGQWVILALFQFGGFGLMTAATMMGLMVNRSLRLRTRLITQAETRTVALGDVASVAKVVFAVTATCELTLTAVLATRLHLHHEVPWPQAAWSGLFHAVSAFNNAGFSLHADSLVRYASDAWLLVPIMVAIVIGGLGFPVMQDIGARWKDPRHWSLHTKITLTGTVILLLLGTVTLMVFEWSNPSTLGPMNGADRLLSAAFASVSARTAGFNSIDIGALTQESWGLHYFLMFIGGGSAGTAGGVKVGTAMILALLVVAEVRGHGDSEAFGRRICPPAQRQAVAVLVLSSAAVSLGTTFLLFVTDFPTDRVIFEVISAFATVGLSTGITADLPPSGHMLLAVLMYAGRVGTITLATSLALGERRMPFRYPEEHPIVG
ncbi:MAG: TrkH family potassium uptake protein [Lautropia sp.]